MKKMKENTVVFQAKNGAIELQIDCKQDTMWANIDEIAELFDIDKSNISRHIKNIFKDKELIKNSTVAKNATVQKMEGSRLIARNIEYFSLDIILAIGYRARSAKRAIEFRKWATKTLKNYITRGFVINPKTIKRNYQEFLDTIEDIKLLAKDNQKISSGDILELIKTFSSTWFSLESYDKESFPKTKKSKKSINLSSDLLYKEVEILKKELISKKEATKLFAQEKNEKSLEGIFGNIFQTAFGNDVYNSIEGKCLQKC